MTTLPCFVGDADPLLVRAPGTDLHLHGTVWLLTQGETRKTKRARLFTEFLARRLAACKPLLATSSRSDVRLSLDPGRLFLSRAQAERALDIVFPNVGDGRCPDFARIEIFHQIRREIVFTHDLQGSDVG